MRKIKVKDKSKKTTTFLVGMNLGIILAAGTASAAILYQSSQVSYSNSSSGLSSTTVQGAIDELANECEPYIEFSIQYHQTSSSSAATYRYEVKAGTTWYNWCRGNGDSVMGTCSSSGPMAYSPNAANGDTNLGYIRKTNSTSGTQIAGNETIAQTTYYVFGGDYCCFDPETLITIDLDGNTKMIKDFEVGDSLVVVNVETNEKLICTVIKDASEHPNTYDFTELTMEDGTTLRFNSYHPIYTTDGYKSVIGYNDYPILKEGDYLVNFDGNPVKITKLYRYEVEEAEMTYNLLIKGVEEDFLEEKYAYLANNKLVHTGIAEYPSEEEYRESHKDRCTKQDLYKDFDFDKATDEEIIDFLVELYKQDPQAEKEYIKYYINAKQYFRYTEFAKQVKQKIKDINLII